MAGERPYIPDVAGAITFDWVVRQFNRISSVITNEQTLTPTMLTSSDSPYTTSDDDKVILADTAGGAITVNLQPGRDERLLYVKNIATSGANNVTVTPDGSDDIDRTGVSATLTPMDSIKIIYSEAEANWFIV